MNRQTRTLGLVAGACAVLALSACGETETQTSKPDETGLTVADDAAPRAGETTASGEQDAGTTDPMPEQADGDADAQLMAFFQRAYEEDLARSPMTQSYRGIKTDYDKWDDLSEDFAKESLALSEARLEELRGFDRAGLTAQNQLSYDIYEMLLERDINDYAFRHHWYTMNQFSAWHTRVPSFLINIHRVSEPADLEAYVARLEGIGALFEQLRTQMGIREEKGMLPPDWTYPQMIASAQNVISGAPFDDNGRDSALLTDFRSKLESLALEDAEKAALEERAIKALTDVVAPAYQALIAELERQAPMAGGDDGVWHLPDGEAYYANRLAYYTTTDLTAEQVHQIGLDSVARIHDDMEAIMEQVEFEGSLQDFFNFMREDEQFYLPNTEEGRETYLNQARAFINSMGERLPDMFGILPTADITVKRVEPFRERSAGKAFYQRPAPDGSRPGIFYANLYDMTQMPTYQLEALAYHEGVPGHHMQIAIAQELTGLPEFRKFAGFTAYIEGWGLYSEFLPKEFGFYEDPYSDFGRLSMELWRACRLVVDTGLHHLRWTREEAIDYLIMNTPNPAKDAEKAIERYSVLPGQATAYLIGMLRIIEMREEAKAALGDQFDIRGFHDEVLRDGAVPLSVLEAKVKAWTDRQSAGE